ncbi:hypothetical protein L1987_75005 [Smallanthus sonchifolius]|uniref:Uncharacterized protein n=1 Tax=Smallanthus sonchifolius TaxID=185202 RepID=A0ACB9A4W5_9ASTR|nr:hypothetical protein L1987_75005 [Smallanthus sonchifolius]
MPRLIDESYHSSAHIQILEKGDYTMISGNPFIKKFGWRKISFYFNISYEIKDKIIEFDDNRNVQRAEFIVRAHMQGGRFSDGWGSCDRREKRFIKPNNNIPSIAETRAKNKACQISSWQVNLVCVCKEGTLQSRLDAEFLLSHMCPVKFKEWIAVLATLLRRSEIVSILALRSLLNFQQKFLLWQRSTCVFPKIVKQPIKSMPKARQRYCFEEEEFNNKVPPTIVKLFASNDRAIRVGLLQHIDQYVESFTAKLVDEQVDEEPAIRTNTIILLGNIASYFNEGVGGSKDEYTDAD